MSCVGYMSKLSITRLQPGDSIFSLSGLSAGFIHSECFVVGCDSACPHGAVTAKA